MSKNKTELTELEKKMDFWVANGLNVLLEGTQGVGKSTMIEEMVARHGFTYKYYTASLMDPYLTLIGVPKEGKDADGGSYLDFIKPQEFNDDSVEFIFLDEFNRAPAAVRNAVMELIQFRSVNGRKLKNLKAVWAAINPYDDNETFNVFELDPAQKDRFHVYHTLPKEPSAVWFERKFGSHQAKTAIKWWNKVPEDIRQDVSPRRLEYALNMYGIGGDVADVLPDLAMPATLVRMLEDFSGGEGTHLHRWMTDSETFLEEIINRTTPTDVDVVEAFGELKKMSMDMAADYVGKLLPEQLTQVRESEHVDILLQNFIGTKNPAIESALKDNVWHPEHVAYVFDSAEENASPKFFVEYEKGDFDAMVDAAETGLDYMLCMLVAKRDTPDDFPFDTFRQFYLNKPAVLKYFTMCDYEMAAKLYRPEAEA